MTAEPSNPLDVRMARLEGGYEQIDKRLTTLETDLTQGLSDIRAEIRSLRNLIFSLFAMPGVLISVFQYLG